MHVADFTVAVKINAESTLHDIYLFAIKAEEKAYLLYEKLGALEEDSSVKDLFKSLADEEREHKANLEKELEEHFTKEN